MPPSPDEWLARVAEDPGLRQTLQAARAWGVSPSRFLGREPAVRHIVANGLVVRSEPEPEWTDDDRDAALALQAWEADLCPGCRQPLAETTLPEREDLYVPGPAIRCHRCTASERGAERYKDSPQRSALMIPVDLRT